MRNKVILDDLSQDERERVTRVLDEIPLEICETRKGLRIFPHLKVRKLGFVPGCYNLIPLCSEYENLDIRGVLPKDVRLQGMWPSRHILWHGESNGDESTATDYSFHFGMLSG